MLSSIICTVVEWSENKRWFDVKARKKKMCLMWSIRSAQISAKAGHIQVHSKSHFRESISLWRDPSDIWPLPSFKLSVPWPQSYLELFRELNELHRNCCRDSTTIWNKVILKSRLTFGLYWPWIAVTQNPITLPHV